MTLREWRRAMRTAVLACAVAGPAFAQQPPVAEEVPDPPEPVQEEWVSWRLPGWSFLPGVTLAAIYDSNVGLADAPASTGRTDSDGMFLVQPFGRVEYHSPRTVFNAGYRGYVRRYTEVDQLNGFDQRFSASVRRRLTRLVTVFASNSFHDVPTTDEVVLNGVPFSRTGMRTNSFTGGVTARLSRSTDLSAQYENTWVAFDHTADAFLAGGVVNGGRATLSRRLSTRLSLGGHYALRLASVNDGERELTFQDAGATVRYDLGPRTSISGAGGVSLLHDRTLDTGRRGPFIRAAIVHGIERATVGAHFQRSLVPAFGFGGSTSTQELGGYVRMPLVGNRLYVQGAVSWRRSDPFLENDLELDTIWARTTVGYALARWVRVEGFHAYTRQDSIVVGGEIDRHRVGIQTVIAQPMRIR
jgi:hypothetical protein